ncbi:MAG: S-layer homology domain-containing protein [Firmicutes bacterium]|nr:S-layer homology domain-containing protein [Bacillota bacterium]
MRKKLLAVIIFALCFGSAAYAEVLGTQSGGWSTYMGASTYFYNVQFTSDSVGNQNEYYVEYTPNEEAVPVVVNGSSIWGTRTIKQAEDYMEENGLRSIAGINADYFSFTTGIPMGYTIIDGEIVSKEYGGQDAVGFRADGTGFIKWLDIQTTVSDGERSVEVMYINKWCQAGFDPIYLLNDKFGTSTKTQSECIFVMCTPKEGRLHVDESMTLTVDDVFIYNGAIEIPDGKMVFVMDTSGQSDLYDFLSRCYAGQELTVTNTAVGDDGTWATAENAVSSVGGRLVSNGVANTDFEAGAAPRTAIGIKENGNIIFYTLDGRQSGYSYGAQLKTLANRMVELGCVDAINLDGGGSTTISALFPGTDDYMVVNSPSDGYLRSVANFIFLKDNRTQTNIPWIVTLKESSNNNYLSGMSAKIDIESAYDTANYKMEEPYNVQYRVETDTQSTVDGSGYVYLNGTGDVNVTLYGDAGDVATRTYSVFETPEEIKIYNQADWKEVLEIYTEANEELQLNLSAASYVNGIELQGNNRMYTWEVEGNIGTVTEDGIFTLADTVNEDGKIKVTAGSCTVEIPVHISDYPGTPNPFYDTEGHWAKDIISNMAAAGIVSGMEEDGQTVFKPDNNMTRAEFASMIANYAQLDLSQYTGAELDFADADNIPQWAAAAVEAVSDAGIMLGKSDDNGNTLFAPYDNITRAEAMAILGRLLPENDDLPTLPFADADDIPQWAREDIQRLYSVGIVSGYEDNTILPNNNITRAESAAMLYKLQGLG